MSSRFIAEIAEANDAQWEAIDLLLIRSHVIGGSGHHLAKEDGGDLKKGDRGNRGGARTGRAGKTQDEELKQGLATIERNARIQAAQIIEDQLDMSRSSRK